jgi:CheY-like chemotaxis protein
MLSLNAQNSGCSVAPAIELLVECVGQIELLELCQHALSRGRLELAAERRLDEPAAVAIRLVAPALRAPLVLPATVGRGCDDGGGEVVLELDAATQEHLAGLVERLARAEPALVCDARRVLIADDNPRVVELIRGGLIGTGRRAGEPRAFDFATATDGRVAQQLLAAHRFDVALIGVYLPPLAPAQVIAAARAGHGRATVIVALAGDEPGAERAAFAAGADAFMAKPVRLRSVYEAIVALTLPRPEEGAT